MIRGEKFFIFNFSIICLVIYICGVERVIILFIGLKISFYYWEEEILISVGNFFFWEFRFFF